MDLHQHHSHSHNIATDGVSQRVNSPRFSGPITRRAHSFKRNNNTRNTQNSNTHNNNNTFSTHHEIDLQLSSPRSESVSVDEFESVLEKKHTHHHLTQRVHVKKSIGSVGIDLGLIEKKKLRHWMFLVFCGVCLFIAVLKICANGWFGSAIERIESTKDVTDSSTALLMDQSAHDGYREEKSDGVGGSDVEQSQMMVASGVVGIQNSNADYSGILSKPNSENFTQCIDRPDWSQKARWQRQMGTFS
ncbi:hypothetical protein F0562_009739 [Nyssa sinensis]|uniref:Uncharacterized protein n=1 Tax=Nyssa sinensis TaxID=561372 RepID=A0A5J4ZZS8_9ASTE|nr:hypothetical protein F0562_009739 [Nyssa sinensis]